MLTIDVREITGPGTSAHPGNGASSFRRILVPVRAPGESRPALAAARICGLAGGVLRLVHVRTCDPPLPRSGRFYLETSGEAAAVLEEALLAAWAGGGPGQHCGGGCPPRRCARDDCVAGGHVARRPDRAGPPPQAGYRLLGWGQRSRSDHAQSQLPRARHPSGQGDREHRPT